MLIINYRLRSAITLHGALHGFRQGRRVLTSTTEAKFDQQLSGMVHKPLFQVFLYVKKSYESLYRGICMDILRGYDIDLNLHRLLQRYCDEQAVVPKTIKLFWRPFGTKRGVTQGQPVSLSIFNIMVG